MIIIIINNNNNNKVKQFNVIIDVLGGWSVDVEETMKDLVGQRSRSVLRRMQKVICHIG